MNEFIVKDFWSYGCSVLHNAAFNLKRHCEVVNKHNISLEKLSDSAHLPTNLQFAFQNDSDLDVPYILNFCGEELEFHDEFLFNSLAKLSSQRLRIVILYYCFDKTDKEISSILYALAQQKTSKLSKFRGSVLVLILTFCYNQGDQSR